MTIEELLIENREILQRMKNEEWDTEKFIKELKGEKDNGEAEESQNQCGDLHGDAQNLG